jgi:L-serine dehydratase
MYRSLEEICEAAEGSSFYEAVLADDCKERGIKEAESKVQMRAMYEAMKQADAGYEAKRVSASGLAGTDGEKLAQARAQKKLICGDLIGLVMEKAVKMGESNACMKRIVAAPTAGSCGVLPAVLLSLEETGSYRTEQLVEALYVAAGIGGVIADRAFIAGAAGGCQAEIGSASAMAAGAVTWLRGRDGVQIIHAAALALKSLLGLACDPVAGLVEVPCIKRNVIGAVNALTASDMAMAGILSRIPPDEVIDAMRNIGRSMPSCLKETGEGGLAVTPTGMQIKEKMPNFM